MYLNTLFVSRTRICSSIVCFCITVRLIVPRCCLQQRQENMYINCSFKKLLNSIILLTFLTGYRSCQSINPVSSACLNKLSGLPLFHCNTANSASSQRIGCISFSEYSPELYFHQIFNSCIVLRNILSIG